MTDPIGRLDLFALDCPDPLGLAEFYRSIVGGTIETGPGGGTGQWIELHTASGNIAFQRIADHRPPTWPTGDVPQQAHLDIDVDDLDVAETAALAVGAVKADVQPNPDQFRVFIDPAGHPFCLVDIRHS
jgi:hypothetical protein